ncbi:hypothetical protein Acr_00g0038420 [Actinidia rufa]|uniref:Uncharacterized protein n=1 Tax=Actinidia rufa TaxID=165716 RepID=A0A7J0DIE0_9ERIC|nr:hypothetical protein Acr_00g0038420 [Actinidia rufa]
MMIPSMIYLAIREIQHIANATEELDGFRESTTTDDEVPGHGGAGVADGEDQRPYGGTEKLLEVKMSRAAMVAVAVDGSSRERGRRAQKNSTQTLLPLSLELPPPPPSSPPPPAISSPPASSSSPSIAPAVDPPPPATPTPSISSINGHSAAAVSGYFVVSLSAVHFFLFGLGLL